jgi:hypothetical protein
MAQIDFTGLTGSLSMLNVVDVDHATLLSASASSYSWTSTNAFTITAHSLAGDITDNGTVATGGTINAITIFNGASPLVSITGLDVPLTSLLNNSNADASHEKFWESVMKGDSTVLMPLLPSGIGVTGDYISVNSGQTRAGADDTITGTNLTGGNLVGGDAFDVEATATLNGGDDRIAGIAGAISGDVLTAGFGSGTAGTVNGGDDTMSATDLSVSPVMSFSFVTGDVDIAASGTVNGGNDRFSFNNVAALSILSGDVYVSTAATVTGGDDAITVQRTGNLFSSSIASIVAGDVYVSQTGANTSGGKDSIVLKNVTAGIIAGDVYSADGNVTGADDTISAIWTAPLYQGAPASAPPPVTASIVAGDVYVLSTNDTVGGGNDKITLKNVINGGVVGDVYTSGGLAAVCGDDTISVVWNQTNISPAFAFMLGGDALSVGSGSLTGGDDIVFASNSANIFASMTLFGDTLVFGGTANMTGGDDRITANSKATTSGAQLYGDAQTVNTTGTFSGGDDTITGTNGADSIYGDAASITAASDTGGNDVLNGKGGNDTIDGGKGRDTAVYSSLKQAVFVDLNGIAGTAPLAADEVEAVGQGSDQLIRIENVTGSALDDTLLGNNGGNEFVGGNGNDYLNGRGGNDVLLGSAGNDTLNGSTGEDTMTGGAGVDHFVFVAVNNTGDTKGTADVITDFTHLTDIIDLSAIDANGGGAGDPAFTFRGNQAITGAAQINVVVSGGNTYVQGNVNANTDPDFVIKIEGLVTLTAADFIL